jgi:ankyrin repeat protein
MMQEAAENIGKNVLVYWKEEILRTIKTSTALVILATLAVASWALAGEIHDAAEGNDVKKVEMLLKRDPRLVNSRNENGKTPLHIAANLGQEEVTKVLLAAKADVNARDTDGRTPLQMAANKEIVAVLLANKADANVKDKSGRTPLHFWAMLGNRAVVEMLLAHDADIHIKDKDGHTPMDLAVARGNKEIVEALLAPPSEKFKLQIAGRAGDTYTTEYQMITKVAPLDETEEVTLLTTKTEMLRVWIETHVKEIKPKGRIAISQRVKRIAVSSVRGADKFEFDSSDAASLEAARQNPNMASLLKFLEGAMQMELEPTGEARDFKMTVPEDPATRNLLEDEVSQPLLLLPEQAVKILETWDCGSQFKAFPGYGRIKVKLEGVLLDVRKDGDDRLAAIGTKGEMTLETDPDSKTKVELQEGSAWGGFAFFSVNKGRITSGYRKVEAVFKFTSQDASGRIYAIAELRIMEAK